MSWLTSIDRGAKMKKFLMKQILIVSIILCLLALFTACTRKPKVDNSTVTVTDMSGDKITIKKNPQKVACCRSAYDLLVGFGLGDKIDGVDKKILANPWTKVFYPNSSKHYAYEYENSYETYLSRGVDLVFSPEKRITDDLRKHGINAVTVSLYGKPTFDNSTHAFANMIAQIWTDKNIKEKVDKWNAKFDNAVSEVANVIKEKNIKKKKLFYVRGDKNQKIGYTDLKGSFAEYAYRTLGFNCMSSILEGDSNKVSPEAICKFNPDLFVMGGIYQRRNVEVIKTTAPYNALDAVKKNKIYTIPLGLTQMEQINTLSPEFFFDQANRLHSEYFSYDIEKMIKTSVKEYFGVELTDKQIEYMLTGLDPNGNKLYK